MRGIMMKNTTIILYFLMLSTNAWGWTYTAHMDSYPKIGENWQCTNYQKGFGSIDSETGTPDPSNALKAHLNGGVINGGEPITCWNLLPTRPKQMYFHYYFKYGSNFSWHPVYNKQIYFKNLDTQEGAGSPRVTFGIRGGGGDYICVIASRFGTTPNYGRSNTGQNVTINKNQWYKVTGRIHFGTPGNSDGTFDIWINDVHTHSYEGVPMLADGDLGINSFDLVPVWGGYVDGLYVPSGGMDQWFDGMIISTDPIEGTRLPGKTPMSATGLDIK